jgi:hypothetical protein
MVLASFASALVQDVVLYAIARFFVGAGILGILGKTI